jgi:anthranilate phosphoribosyltransferase
VKSKGQTIEESAQMFTNTSSLVLERSPNKVVCANAGIAIATTTECTEGFQMAQRKSFSGKS